MSDPFFNNAARQILTTVQDKLQRQHEQQYTLADLIRWLEEQREFPPVEDPTESPEKQTTEEDDNTAMDDVTRTLPPGRIYQELLAGEKMLDGNGDMIPYHEACLGEKIKSTLMLTPGGALFITSFRGIAPTGERPMPSYEDLERLKQQERLGDVFLQ